MLRNHSECLFYSKMAIIDPRFESQLLNEIMPMIYKRFTEKAAEEWRQIYKVFHLEYPMYTKSC